MKRMLMAALVTMAAIGSEVEAQQVRPIEIPRPPVILRPPVLVPPPPPLPKCPPPTPVPYQDEKRWKLLKPGC